MSTEPRRYLDSVQAPADSEQELEDTDSPKKVDEAQQSRQILSQYFVPGALSQGGVQPQAEQKAVIAEDPAKKGLPDLVIGQGKDGQQFLVMAGFADVLVPPTKQPAGKKSDVKDRDKDKPPAQPKENDSVFPWKEIIAVTAAGGAGLKVLYDSVFGKGDGKPDAAKPGVKPSDGKSQKPFRVGDTVLAGEGDIFIGRDGEPKPDAKEAKEKFATLTRDEDGKIFLQVNEKDGAAYIKRRNGQIEEVKPGQGKVQIKPGEQFSTGDKKFHTVAQGDMPAKILKVPGTTGDVLAPLKPGDTIEIGRGLGGKPVTRGNGEVRVDINSDRVSSTHARVGMDDKGIFIVDGKPGEGGEKPKGSTNGTYVNGEKLEPGKKTYIKDTDQVTIGDPKSPTHVPLSLEKPVKDGKLVIPPAEPERAVKTIQLQVDGKTVANLGPNHQIEIGRRGHVDIGGAHLADNHAAVMIDAHGNKFIRANEPKTGEPEPKVWIERSQGGNQLVKPKDGWVPLGPNDNVSAGGSKFFKVAEVPQTERTVSIAGRDIKLRQGDKVELGRGNEPTGTDGMVRHNVPDKDGYVSRRHAELGMDEKGRTYIVDVGTEGTGSENGTYVNGTRIEPNKPVPITDRDVVTLGNPTDPRSKRVEVAYRPTDGDIVGGGDGMRKTARTPVGQPVNLDGKPGVVVATQDNLRRVLVSNLDPGGKSGKEAITKVGWDRSLPEFKTIEGTNLLDDKVSLRSNTGDPSIDYVEDSRGKIYEVRQVKGENGSWKPEAIRARPDLTKLHEDEARIERVRPGEARAGRDAGTKPAPSVDAKPPSDLRGTIKVGHDGERNIRIGGGIGDGLPHESIGLSAAERKALGGEASKFDKVVLTIRGEEVTYFRPKDNKDRFYILAEGGTEGPKLVRDYEVFREPGSGDAGVKNPGVGPKDGGKPGDEVKPAPGGKEGPEGKVDGPADGKPKAEAPKSDVRAAIKENALVKALGTAEVQTSLSRAINRAVGQLGAKSDKGAYLTQVLREELAGQLGCTEAELPKFRVEVTPDNLPQVEIKSGTGGEAVIRVPAQQLTEKRSATVGQLYAAVGEVGMVDALGRGADTTSGGTKTNNVNTLNDAERPLVTKLAEQVQTKLDGKAEVKQGDVDTGKVARTEKAAPSLVPEKVQTCVIADGQVRTGGIAVSLHDAASGGLKDAEKELGRLQKQLKDADEAKTRDAQEVTRLKEQVELAEAQVREMKGVVSDLAQPEGSPRRTAAEAEAKGLSGKVNEGLAERGGVEGRLGKVPKGGTRLAAVSRGGAMALLLIGAGSFIAMNMNTLRLRHTYDSTFGTD